LTSAFLAELSHDLRTPLNGVLGFALLLHEGRLGPLSAEQQECLGDVLTSARQLLQIINEISDLGRVESGTLEFRPERVDVASLLETLRDDVATLSAPKQVEVTGAIDPALGEIVADPARLRQALASYLGNAVKATPEGGRVAIRVTAEDATRFRIEVEDGGSRARDLEDGDVGLTLGRRLVEAQGGRLGVRSASGRGSVVFVILPRAPGP